MVVKINVSLPEDVLEELDKAVVEAHATRSGLLVQAIKRYLAEMQEQRQREKRRRAADAMDRIRDEYGGWDGTAEVLRWRDLH